MTELKIILDNSYVYIFVFIRMAAAVGFNSVISRREVPMMVRSGLVFLMTMLLAPTVAIPEGYENSSADLLIGIVREIAVGFLLGYVFNIFYYMLTFVGDVLDMQFGLSMAKVLDPGTGVQTAFTGKFINLLFVTYFFATDCHLVLMKTAAYSFDMIPAGAENINIGGAVSFGINVFVSAFSLAIRLAFPFVAMEFVLEIGMGILMKLIPQIHIFVINMQFKVMLAIIMLMILAKPITVFLENYLLVILDQMQEALQSMMT